MAGKTKTTSLLLEALYPKMCQDANEGEVGTATHKAATLLDIKKVPLMNKKGERVALRRWYSWVKSASFHVQSWHTGLFVHMAVAMHQGLYKKADDTPLFVNKGLPTDEDLKPAPEEEGDQEAADHSKDLEAAGSIDKAAKDAALTPSLLL